MMKEMKILYAHSADSAITFSAENTPMKVFPTFVSTITR